MTPGEKARAVLGLVFGGTFGALLGSAGPLASGVFVSLTCAFLAALWSGTVAIGAKR